MKKDRESIIEGTLTKAIMSVDFSPISRLVLACLAFFLSVLGEVILTVQTMEAKQKGGDVFSLEAFLVSVSCLLLIFLAFKWKRRYAKGLRLITNVLLILATGITLITLFYNALALQGVWWGGHR